MVLPALREHIDDQLMLRELVKCWNIQKAMLHWMNTIFKYLDSYFIEKHSLPAVREVGIMYYRELVFPVVRINEKNATISLIHLCE
jgi:cullin 1